MTTVFDQTTGSGNEQSSSTDNTSTNISDNNSGGTNTTDHTLVGPGKKYATVADLEASRTEADRFIEQLKEENKGLRQDLDSRLTVEDALNKLTNGESQSTESNTSSAVDADTLAKLVAEQVNLLDTSKVKENNLRAADAKLAEAFGDKAPQHLAEKAQELSVSVDFLKSTAETSPQAFYNLIGLQVSNVTEPAPTKSTSTVNTQAMNQNSEGKDWAYYEKMRVQDPRTYWTPAIQNELFKAKRAGQI